MHDEKKMVPVYLLLPQNIVDWIVAQQETRREAAREQEGQQAVRQRDRWSVQAYIRELLERERGAMACAENVPSGSLRA